MIGNAIKWLTDPEAIGRKRAICAVFLVLAGALHGVDGALHSACDQGTFHGAVCRIDPDAAAGNIEIGVEWLKGLEPGADVVGGLVGLWALVDARRKAKAKAAQVAAAAGLLVLALMLPSAAMAQETSANRSEPFYTVVHEAVQLTLHGGAMQFAERGKPDKRDFVYRLTLNVPAPAGMTVFARADYTRTQDGGDLLDVKTFRSVEALLGAKKDLGSGFAATAFSGVTWNRDDKVNPADPRLWTAAAGLRYTVPGRGYVVAAAGHHGPVGGRAFLGSVVYEINSGASWFADVAIPLDAERFAARPYTLKAGISARLKGWKF